MRKKQWMIFLLLLAVTAAGGVLAWLAGEARMDNRPIAYAGVFILVIAGWVVSLCLHEFGHAFTAWRFGDHDAATRGYLSLNPLEYTSPVFSIVLPLLFIAMGGIGLPGGAVWVRTGAMTKSQRTLVSLAGPLVNLVLAVVLLGAVQLFYRHDHSVFWSGVAFLALLQVMAEQFARSTLGLRFSHWSVQPWQRGVNFCGYRIWPTHKLLRRSSVTRAKYKLAELAKSGD